MKLLLRNPLSNKSSFSRFVVSILLIAAICFLFSPVPNAKSQSNATWTTMTMKQPSPGGCAMLSLAFSGQADAIIRGTFGSDAPISLYILSQNDFYALVNCRLPASANPLFSQENIAGFENAYRARVPADGTYYYVFTMIGSTFQLTSGYATVRLSIPVSVTLTALGTSSTMVVEASTTMGSSNLIEMITALSSSPSTTSSTYTSTSTPALATTAKITETVRAQWYADIGHSYMILGGIGATIVIFFIVVLVMMRRRGRITPAPTRPAMLTSTQQAMDLSANLNDSCEYAKKLFSDLGRLVILIILGIIPIVNWIVFGYAATVLKESPGQDAPPKLERYSELFGTGAKVAVVHLIYYIIPIVLTSVLILRGMLAAGVLLAVVLAILVLIVHGVGTAHMIKTGQFGKAFAFSEIFAIIRGIGWGKYLGWTLLTVVILTVVLAIGAIPYVGWPILFIIFPVLSIFLYRSLGILYNDGAPQELRTQPQVSSLPPGTLTYKTKIAIPVDQSVTTSQVIEVPKETKFCRHCGSKMPRDSTFCEECGTKFSS